MTKQLEALVKNGIVGKLKYEADSGNLVEVQKLADIMWRARRSHLTKIEKARFGL